MLGRALKNSRNFTKGKLYEIVILSATEVAAVGEQFLSIISADSFEIVEE